MAPQRGPICRRPPRPYLIELNRRFAFPTACFVLMLVGVPLGLSSKRGGKGTGFVLTLFLVFLYYFLSTVGIALATQGKLAHRSWRSGGANIGFLLTGCCWCSRCPAAASPSLRHFERRACGSTSG